MKECNQPDKCRNCRGGGGGGGEGGGDFIFEVYNPSERFIFIFAYPTIVVVEVMNKETCSLFHFT